MIEFYRLALSPHFGGACRFSPSCSDYATECFQTHPPPRAFFLVLKRLGRCRPGGAFGYDPVPENSGFRGDCATTK